MGAIETREGIPLTFDMGKPGVDLTKAVALAAELEDEELIARYRRSR
jgi:hypothetical protein